MSKLQVSQNGTQTPVAGTKSFDFKNFAGDAMNFMGSDAGQNAIGDVVNKAITSVDQFKTANAESNSALKAGMQWQAGYDTTTKVLDTVGQFSPVFAAIAAGFKIGDAIGKKTNNFKSNTLMSDKVNANPFFTGSTWAANEQDRLMKGYNSLNGFGKSAYLRKNGVSMKNQLAGNKKTRQQNTLSLALTGITQLPFFLKLNTDELKRKEDEQNRAMLQAQNIVTQSEHINQGIANFGTTQQQANKIQKMGGIKPAMVGKKGMKLDMKASKELIAKWNLNPETSNPKPETLKQGGSIIVEGARHHEKNEIPIDGITEKGVPVISIEEGGEIEQHAEVEGGELIFSHEVTTKVLELKKDGSKEAAIEAGKIIAKEIIKNTKNAKTIVSDPKPET
jgi:hypothetical protein